MDPELPKRRATTNTHKCPYCHGIYNARGYPPHKQSCKRKHAPDDEELDDLDPDGGNVTHMSASSKTPLLTLRYLDDQAGIAGIAPDQAGIAEITPDHGVDEREELRPEAAEAGRISEGWSKFNVPDRLTNLKANRTKHFDPEYWGH
jgi:hypothetical protein